MDPKLRETVVRSTLIVLLLVGLALLLVPLSGVLMLIFASILIAVLIRAAAIPFRKIGLPETLAVLLGLIAIIALLGFFGWMFGTQLGDEFRSLTARLPGAVRSAEQWVSEQPWGQDLQLSSITGAVPNLQSIAGGAFSFAFGALGALTNLVLVLIAAIYLALQPITYMRGIEHLFPKAQGEQVSDALAASGAALQRYLLGQLFTMTIVGTLVAVGLTIFDVPSAAALGVIVGLANFVPMIGPLVGAIPGVLLAFSQGPETALAAAIVYLVAQQFEGNVLTPIVQRWAVSIPPALLLFALAGLGVLFGFVGVIVAAPLAVVLYTLVTMLWSRDALGHDVSVPGRSRNG
ncbi:AI-2E family transporter [Stakelama tenebrarum]|uniref:AI-2E family transporter n=1 Tax=Stakelama tenebrarum TaxID=2711215 RepID=A0A6G6Y147_9SPHN|nr:AI-2E family transporter [Sphingosinithalassobacter tenebrarum]QIG78630.1 AI-2E family transporter [Sphingosinithalassobacter tenebrarum]